MKRRIVQQLLRRRLEENPAVVLVGPRQAGKTTLAKTLSPLYFDLEQSAERIRLDATWDQVEASKRLVVFDEAQTWPELFARLRGAIDARRARHGRFLLLGSVSPRLMLHVSESLAGRLAVVEMTPLLATEISPAERRRHWLMGGYPAGGVLKPSAFPTWLHDYLTLLVQRDLPTWGLPLRPQVAERLLRMVGAVHGQAWNASQLGQGLGVSYHSVNSYLDYLEGAFLVRRLSPLAAKLSKRLVKAPRVYIRDTGVLHALLRVEDERSLFGQPWVGASFEGYVIEQLLGALLARGKHFEAAYFRTSDGLEIDLVLDVGRLRWAIEVKLSSSPAPQDLDRLSRAGQLVGAQRCALVCRVLEPFGAPTKQVLNIEALLERVLQE